MKKFEYKEPEFKVVATSTEDVITTSEVTPNENYNPGAFEAVVGL